MTKVREETGEYTSVHSSNLHIDFPGKMRYSWGNGVVRRGNRGWSARSRYAKPIWIESRLRHAISTEEVKKEKNLTRKQERKETGGGRGRSTTGKREEEDGLPLSRRWFLCVVWKRCRLRYVAQSILSTTPRVSDIRVFPCTHIRDKTSTSIFVINNNNNNSNSTKMDA